VAPNKKKVGGMEKEEERSEGGKMKEGDYLVVVAWFLWCDRERETCDCADKEPSVPK
jgi:hypothetical protein